MFKINTIKPEPEGTDEECECCGDELIIPINKNLVPNYVGVGFAM